MSDLLSDGQINALFEAARQGDDVDGFQKEEKKRRQSVREIDFSRPTKFTREQQRRIERAHEGFCRNAGNGFTAELRTTVEFDVLNAAQLSWMNATAEIPTASTYGIVTVQPLGTRALLAVETTGVMRVLERMLGGGALGPPATRQLTDIDLTLTRRFFTALLRYLSPTWDDLLDITLELEDIETQASSTHLAPPSEPSISISFEIAIEGHSATIAIIVPYPSISGVAHKLNSAQYDENGTGIVDAATTAAVKRALSGIEIELRAEVASTELSIDKLLAIVPGDVIQMNGSVQSGVTLYADKTPIHRSRPGRLGGRRAVQILERLEPDQ